MFLYMKKSSIVLIILLLCSLLQTAAPLWAEHSQSDLQADIDHPPAGGVITYYPGDYDVLDSPISISDSITLQCGGGLFDLYYPSPASDKDAIVIENEGGSPITVTIRNFEISNARTAIAVTGNVELIVEGCIFHHNAEHGISIESPLEAVITGSLFKGIGYEEGANDSHILLIGGPATVTGCVFGEAGSDIDENIGIIYIATDSPFADVIVTGCVFNRVFNGVIVEGSAGASFAVSVDSNTLKGAQGASDCRYTGLICDVGIDIADGISQQLDDPIYCEISFCDNTATNIHFPAVFEAGDISDIYVMATGNSLEMEKSSLPLAGDVLTGGDTFIDSVAFRFVVDNPLDFDADIWNNTVYNYRSAVYMESESDFLPGTLETSSEPFGTSTLPEEGYYFSPYSLFVGENDIVASNGINAIIDHCLMELAIFDNSFEYCTPQINPSSDIWESSAICIVGYDASVASYVYDNTISGYIFGVVCNSESSIEQSASDITGNVSIMQMQRFSCVNNMITGGITGILCTASGEGFVDMHIGNNVIYGVNEYIEYGDEAVLPETEAHNLKLMVNTGICAQSFSSEYGRVLISNNTVADCGTGCVLEVADNCETYVVNNILARNEVAGLYLDAIMEEGNEPVVSQQQSPYPFGVLCNDVWGNGTGYLAIADQTGLNGNISKDPLFSNGYMLEDNSPCIDAGYGPGYIVPGQDILHQSRPIGHAYDIGAYEMHIERVSPEATYSPVVSSRLAVVNASLAEMLASLPQQPSPDTELLLDQIQGMLDGISLANSIQAMGKLEKVLDLLAQIGA